MAKKKAVNPARRSFKGTFLDRSNLVPFRDWMLETFAGLDDFLPGARGWCYLLEADDRIQKDEFDTAEGRITKLRKDGDIPVDICADDSSRVAVNLEELHTETPEQYAAYCLRQAGLHARAYTPVSFWEFQPVYLEVYVEKIDLLSLFRNVCAEYNVAISNFKGSPDVNQRIATMRRFKQWADRGKKCLLLVCGDFDPPGVKISASLFPNFRRLERTLVPDGYGGHEPVNYRIPDGAIERFGLNDGFIRDYNLSRTPNLVTSGGNDLANPPADRKKRKAWERMYEMYDIGPWLENYGEWKVEANALVTRPEEGRALCRRAIQNHLDPAGIEAYEARLQAERAKVWALLPPEVRETLRNKERCP